MNSFYEGDRSTSSDKAEKTKETSPSPFMDKTLVEAKTWVPQEIYRQPSKSITGQDRSQFPPGKDKQNVSMRMVLDMGRKAGNSYEPGGSTGVLSENAKKTEPTTPIGGKQVKAAVPSQYAVPMAVVPSCDTVGNPQDS